MTKPADQTAFVNTGTTGIIDLGNNFPAISFNNSSPFSFEVWVRVRQLPTVSASILAKTSEFVLGYSTAGNITVWRGGLIAGLTSSATIGANQWFHVGVTFDGQTMTLYLNGLQDSFIIVTSAGVPNQGSDFQLGIKGNMDIDTCRMWSIAQTSSYMYQAPWAPSPAQGTAGLVADYDLSQTPPRDVSGNNNPITLTAPAASMLSAPGVLLSGSAYVDPLEVDLVRCGDTPYTIDAWLFQTTTTGPQAIFASGNLNDSGAVSLWLDSGVLKSQRGLTVLAATGPAVSVGTWTHVATTYDGTTLTVYINGVGVGSVAAGSIPSLLAESAVVGAFNTATGGQANFLQGYVQYVSVWTLALTASQILDLMYDDPTLKPGCVANFAFSQTQPVDLNTGAPLSLNGGAVLDEQISPWTSSETLRQQRTPLTLPENLYQRLAQQQLHKADAVVRHLSKMIVQEDSKPLETQEHIELLLAELSAAFPASMGVEERALMLEAYKQQLNALTTDGPPRPGTVTHAIVDGYHVLTLHGPDSAEEVFRAEVGTVDPCTVWWIGFIITLLVGFATLTGLTAPLTERVSAYATELANDVRLMAAIMPLFVVPVTAQTILSFLALIYYNGYMWQFLKFCFSQALSSWWNRSRFVYNMIARFSPFPTPEKIAFIFNAAALVVNLALALRNKPANC